MTAPKLLALGGLLLPLAAWPAALTDGTAGAVQSLSGRFTVPQSLGTVRGANLFHSFTRFGVAAGESATFNTNDAGLRHVITRLEKVPAFYVAAKAALEGSEIAALCCPA